MRGWCIFKNNNMKNKTIWAIIGIVVLLGLLNYQSNPKATQCSKWKIISYPYWTAPLTQFQYDNFNIIFEFNIAPNSDGTLSYEAWDLADVRADVATAHANNDLILLVIGGWGYGPGFAGATTSAHRAAFVNNIANAVTAAGYDGISFDWEEDVNNANLVQTIKDLRTKFNTMSPKPILLIDVCCDVTINSIAQIAPYVDSINTMDYETNVAGYYNELVNAGVPSNKIVNGLGFYAWVNSEARARSEAQYVVDHNMQGIEVWDSSEFSTGDARVYALNDVLGNGPACPISDSPFTTAKNTYLTGGTLTAFVSAANSWL